MKKVTVYEVGEWVRLVNTCLYLDKYGNRVINAKVCDVDYHIDRFVYKFENFEDKWVSADAINRPLTDKEINFICLEVGDVVEIIEQEGRPTVGLRGVVADATGSGYKHILVDFGEAYQCFHNADGRLPLNTGWWFSDAEVKKIDPTDYI